MLNYYSYFHLQQLPLHQNVNIVVTAESQVNEVTTVYAWVLSPASASNCYVQDVGDGVMYITIALCIE